MDVDHSITVSLPNGDSFEFGIYELCGVRPAHWVHLEQMHRDDYGHNQYREEWRTAFTSAPITKTHLRVRLPESHPSAQNYRRDIGLLEPPRIFTLYDENDVISRGGHNYTLVVRQRSDGMCMAYKELGTFEKGGTTFFFKNYQTARNPVQDGMPFLDKWRRWYPPRGSGNENRAR